MDLKAGRCSLIVNGTAFADFSCVIELLDNAEPQGFGFLSGGRSISSRLLRLPNGPRSILDTGKSSISASYR
jgi:hypothetical protein